MPTTYCHVSYCKLHLLKQKIDGVLFYWTEKNKWASFQESQAEYSMSAFNYGVGAINTWVLLCSVFHGWLLRKYNSQKLAI